MFQRRCRDLLVSKCNKDENDEQIFENESAISTGSFLDLLSFYLNITYVMWKGQTYKQTSGVCIDAKIAHILRNNFLTFID